jgi:hypothetical protein
MLGVLLLIVGLVGLAIGVVFFMRLKKLASAPFRKTGEIAGNPTVTDAKGMISTEGQIVAPQPVRAPCSGQPCLYYEVTIEREWEKMVTTQQGTSKKTGTTKVTTNRGGAIFQVNDGSGAVNIDAREGVEADLNKVHDERVTIGMVIPGEVQFGQWRMQTPVNLGPDRTTAFKATEKILPAQGNLYACGKLVNGAISKPGWSALVLSHKGRDALMGSTKTKAVAGLVVGGLLTVSSVPAFLFGPKMDSGNTCKQAMTDAPPKCDDRLTDADGKDYQWNVTKAGVYTLRVIQPKVANPIDATLTVKDTRGVQVAYNDGGSPGQDAHVAQYFDVGAYSINVRDFNKDVVEGGFTYSLVITYDGPSGTASGVAGANATSTTTVTSATTSPPETTATAKKGGGGGAGTGGGKGKGKK